MIKRIIDLVVSSILLLILSPFLVIIALIIKIDSKGPVIFKQERVGFMGKPFEIYKFRSMNQNSPKYGRSPKNFEDTRLTRIGKFIRKFSIDEIPQLFNVLKGEMSLIGPRAITKEEVKLRIEAYQREGKVTEAVAIKKYEKRQNVKPGMTGLTQINGRSNAGVIKATDLDYYYANNFSVLLDCKIIFRTIGLLIYRKGTN